MINSHPFHQGELDVQKLTGEQAIASRVGKLIQNSIPTRAFDFIHHQSVIWIGIEGQNSFLWAFPLFGSPGFINPNIERRLEISLEDNFSIPDKWFRSLQKSKAIGCLVIDLSTRSRVRINGIIREVSKNNLQIDIQQSYPNCPKYIRKREIRGEFAFAEFTIKSSGIELNEQAKSIINSSDTAFVTSLALNGADVSHRGGKSGFIKYDFTNKILVPDYKGNSMFNTLGNFIANPQGGLIIVDFTRGYYLQLSGKINIIFDKELSILDTGGTNRFWELEIHKWYLFQLKSSFKWNNLDFSPYNP
jgi:hypothetical protein